MGSSRETALATANIIRLHEPPCGCREARYYLRLAYAELVRAAPFIPERVPGVCGELYADLPTEIEA